MKKQQNLHFWLKPYVKNDILKIILEKHFLIERKTIELKI